VGWFHRFATSSLRAQCLPPSLRAQSPPSHRFHQSSPSHLQRSAVAPLLIFRFVLTLSVTLRDPCRSLYTKYPPPPRFSCSPHPRRSPADLARATPSKLLRTSLSSFILCPITTDFYTKLETPPPQLLTIPLDVPLLR